MAEDERAKISDLHTRRIREVAFPLGDEGAFKRQEREFHRLTALARMLKTTVEELEREEREDRVPDWDGHGNILATPIEARATGERDDMANENAEKILAEGWDEVAKASASSGNWLKFENNQIHILNVFSKPVFFEKVWEGEAKRRVRVDVYIPGEGIKRWEMAPGTLRDLAEERSDAKNPFEDALFAVKRTGMGKETRFKMRYQRQLTAAEAEERATLAGPASSDEQDPF